ncbi:hypothetical protein SSPO_031850 [Streptomyces antimycoticus]|uniref:DNA topoisomerase (ATP-hydrolyzing) n=1 Tax=Streptomyces antimycoticus TaxID=68175 RepID=A0A499V2S1_9ACTN|nr:hypothetical protein SSPO_031850 [Streptomyces antimycoticus]
MTKLHAGGKFGGGSYAASGGLHGVGASVVNALSARLDVEVDRDAKTHAISFRRGVPGIFTESGPDAPFDPSSGLLKGKRVPKTRTGTRIRYWADRQIFLKDAKLSLETLYARARQTAFLVPGLTLVVRDERALEGREGPVEETFRYDGGISEFCEYLAQDKAVCDVLRLSGQGTFKETVPVLDDRGHMTPTEVTRDLGVDIALRWGTGYDATVKSFVNIIATPKGGTHVAGFERAITRTVNEALRTAKLLRVAEDDVVKDDAMEGLTAVVTVRLAEPQFEGQTKEVLGTSAASRIVANVVSKELKEFLTSSKRDAKQQARAVLEKVVAAARTRIAARQHKEAQRRKTALESSSLPAKLADCRSDDVGRSELFIVEGDSALGTAKLARNSEFQALLPIRGKILNVQKSSISDMLKNAECGAIIQVIGAGSGRTFDIDQARYGKVIFLADADVDGAHIRCLLLTLFQRYMRPMVEQGRVFSAVPPLHRVELVNPKRGRASTSTPTPTRSSRRRCWTSSAARSATRTASSATRVSARWTPTSSRRPRWTRATAPCGASTSAIWRPPSAPSTCSWAMRSRPVRSSSPTRRRPWTGRASTSDARPVAMAGSAGSPTREAPSAFPPARSWSAGSGPFTT